MNSKLVILGLMISSLVAISASGRGQTTTNEVILQDDKSGDHLRIGISTGEYKFESCQGNVSSAGVGKISVSGCKLALTDMSDTTRVLAEVDLCDGIGKADVAFEDPRRAGPRALEFVISDSNTKDSAFNCESKVIVLK
jgi:hypothetical protein